MGIVCINALLDIAVMKGSDEGRRMLRSELLYCYMRENICTGVEQQAFANEFTFSRILPLMSLKVILPLPDSINFPDDNMVRIVPDCSAAFRLSKNSCPSELFFDRQYTI